MNLTANFLQKKAAADFRKLSGSSKIEKVLRKAVGILASQGIPSLVIGGLAVQEYGYARFTKDGDLAVPDAIRAEATLLNRGFRKTKYPGTVIDGGVEIDLVQAGARLNNSKVPMITPTAVSSTVKFCELRDLVELKLAGYQSLPFLRAQDATDVGKLIVANDLPPDFLAGSVEEDLFQWLWNGLHKEQR
jgi:hypothetical protein